MQADDGYPLEITRRFHAPAPLVFAMWTEARHMGRWMGPETFRCTRVEVDLRVGGCYRMCIESPDEGANWFGGEYRLIEPYRRLEFTFAWDNNGPSAGVETLVAIELTEHAGVTTQRFVQRPFLAAERRDAHSGGWCSSFTKLAAYIDTLSTSATQSRDT